MSVIFTRKVALFLLLNLFGIIQVFGQTVYKGKVTDETNEPLIGVVIKIKGTGRGTATDNDGNFTIKAKQDDVLQVTYLGYTSNEITLGKTTIVNISLKNNAKDLNEVVVIGYGAVKKRDLTGAVASVSAEQLKDASSVSFGDALRGKLSGVQVSSSGGEPGSGLDIKVRGTNSISASSSPLFVIDGVPIESNQSEVKTGGVTLNNPTINPLSYLDPANIASIEVLKDASAAAIYGSRGANGVIIITTKSGAPGVGQVGFNISAGTSVFNKRIDMLDAATYGRYIHDRIPSNPFYTDQVTGAIKPLDPSLTVNWQDELYRNAGIQNYNLNFSGNTDKSKLYISLGYNDTKGIIIGSDFQRLSFLLNGTAKISDKFDVNVSSNTGYSNRAGQLYGTGQGASAGITYRILSSKPFDAGELSLDDGDATYNSPLRFVQESQKNTKSLTNLTNITLNYHFSKDLTLKILGGGYITNAKNSAFLSKSITNASNSNGLANLGQSTTFNWLNENTLNYAKSWKDHKLTALVGFTAQQNTIESFYLTASNFSVETNGINAIQDALSINAYNSDKTQWALVSYLGRLNYSYKDRYQFTASLRTDGSSKFYGDNKYSYFPAGAFAWQLGEEPFIKKLKTFDLLKVRLSYGQIGNQGIPSYSALSKASTVRYYSGSTEFKGAQTSSVANTGLTWEASETLNGGLDVSILNSRINLNVDLYIKNTKNLLLQSPVPGSTGFSSIFQNVGRLQNKGLEIVLSTQNIAGNFFRWNTDLNFNLNQNIVKALDSQNAIYYGSLVGNNSVPPNIIKVGKPLGSLYGLIADGLYQASDFDAGGALKSGVPLYGTPKPGYLKFKDISGPNGVPDGVIDNYDRGVIGNSNPKHFGGIRNVFTYKNLTLSTFVSWQYGNQLLNWSERFLNGADYNNVTVKYYTSMYTAANTNTNTPSVADPIGRNEPSTYYVQDASFLRLQNINVSYNLPLAFVKRLKISSLALSFSVDNLATITNYSGYDPEQTSTDPANSGVDFFSYPRPKTFTFGLNARF